MSELGSPQYRKTDIPCFECGERSGVDCPGRKPGEATRCFICLNRWFLSEMYNSPRDNEYQIPDEQTLIDAIKNKPSGV